jgi:hypothetical protein
MVKGKDVVRLGLHVSYLQGSEQHTTTRSAFPRKTIKYQETMTDPILTVISRHGV